ncbi:MAG: hypothetical protein ACRDFB_06395 [Rhabdochlamydiaceae bacterium]
MGGRLYQFGVLATVMILAYLVLVHSGGAAQVGSTFGSVVDNGVSTFQGNRPGNG